MTPEEFKAKAAEILKSLDDQAKVSNLLTELTEYNDTSFASFTQAAATGVKLTEDNEKLRQANLNLFLKVGSEKKEEKKEEEDQTPKFEDLFDENGDLK